jgi:sphinganine C4-monooxygenase
MDKLQRISGGSWSMTDAQAAAVVPIIGYWIVSIFYEACSYLNLFSDYHVYQDPKEQKKNVVSKGKVLRVVLLMQALQVSFALYMTRFDAPPSHQKDAFGSLEYFQTFLLENDLVGPSVNLPTAVCLKYIYLMARQLLAFFLFDTWAYWLHYFEHRNTWIYRKD